MCKGNCGKCKKAEDVKVDSLAERSGMIVDDGWISVHDMSPPTDKCGIESVVVIAATSDDDVRSAFMERIEDNYSWTAPERRFKLDVTHWRSFPPPPVK